MKPAVIVALLLLVVGAGCNRARDYRRPDGTKIVGERTLKDGTVTRERVEYANGWKSFDVTVFPDGTEKDGRFEFPDGEKGFDVTLLPGGTEKTGRFEFPDGRKNFDVTTLPDGTQKSGRDELPDGSKIFDSTILPDGTKKSGRVEFPDGRKNFDVTTLPDGTQKDGRAEFPDGEKRFDVTWLPDETQKYGRAELPDGSKNFDVTVLKNGTVKIGRSESAPTWTDPATGLMWEKQENSSARTWNESNNYCSNLRLAGHSNWRLATPDELTGIYDQTQNVNGAHIKGGIKLTMETWSNDPGDGNPGGGLAWVFTFGDPMVGANFNGPWPGSQRAYNRTGRGALCVRSPEQ